MTNEFTVVGEHREDETHLLVLGADGEYYGYLPAREELSPVDPDEHWVMYPGTEDPGMELSPMEPDMPRDPYQ